MAEQIKYVSEEGRIYRETFGPVLDDFRESMKNLGGKVVRADIFTDSGAWDYRLNYEFPRKGAILAHFKELAERPNSKLPKEYAYNVCIDLVGFREDTKKYKKIKSSIEEIFLVEGIDSFEDALYFHYK